MFESQKVQHIIPKSSQDTLGIFLSNWRNFIVSKKIRHPFLDIACGDNILKKKKNGGIGIDVINYGTADVLVKNFNTQKKKKNSFNSVAIVASLNYFEKPQQVLIEVSRVLKPCGILILTLFDPFIAKLWHIFREPWARNPSFSSDQLMVLSAGSGLILTERHRFMLGMNNLYLLKKNE